ncbi:hypothetical protein [Winogradskyella sp. SM1960]|uniref:hypothetical protein n=1 Tax=Winogradskyella sp. SM1960 TaxID=2865955 RepID=UPI001CD3BDD9|nr:hypothetical protein [Winogradskyella sp. SM1960]
MQFKTNLTQKLPFFVALGVLTVLTSCGSFQYAGYDNDGIYATEDYENNTEETVVTTSVNDSQYYKNYFAENSAEVDAIQEESEIFTDIDTYEGNYTEQVVDTLEQQPVYGGWGQISNTVTINYIDNGWYGYNSPWMWNSGFGYGYRHWGYNFGPYGGYYGGYYGYRHYAPWRYGYGYYNYGLNNRYYRNNRYAYNTTRRGSLLYNNNLNRRSNAALSRSNAALSRNNYSTRRLSNAVQSNSRVRSNRRTTTTSPTRTIRNSSSSTRRSRPATTRRSSNRSTTRSATSTRSTRSSATVRSRSSSTRSSGSTVRSSASSRSSSGSRSSSSSSRRGGRR